MNKKFKKTRATKENVVGRIVKPLWLIIFSPSVFAVDINAAYSATFFSLLTLLAFAFGAFKLLTLGIPKSGPISSINKGRKFAAWTVGFLIFSSANFYKEPNADYFYRLCLVTIPLGLIAFLIGCLWFKYKKEDSNEPIKVDDSNPNQKPVSKKNIPAIIASVLLIAGLVAILYSNLNGNLGRLTGDYGGVSNDKQQLQNSQSDLYQLNLVRGITNISLLELKKKNMQDLSDMELREVIVVSGAQKNNRMINEGKILINQLSDNELMELNAVQQAYGINQLSGPTNSIKTTKGCNIYWDGKRFSSGHKDKSEGFLTAKLEMDDSLRVNAGIPNSVIEVFRSDKSGLDQAITNFVSSHSNAIKLLCKKL